MAAEGHILGGIDEAGLGPVLGPLVVAGLTLWGPEGRSPWKILQRTFCKKPRSRRDRRIRVDDSKRVHQGRQGRAELERTALSLVCATEGRLPRNLAALLALGRTGQSLARYPWYQDLERTPLPRWNDPDTLELDAHLAGRETRKAGIRCLGYPFHVVDVGTLNGLIRRHDNKSVMLFEATVPVVQACLGAARGAGDELARTPATLVIDRHGGRGHYRDLLARAFPTTPIDIRSEGPRVSRYRLGERTDLVFAENGEDRAFPTAAASCLAKYVRELLVERINAWFQRRQPDLKPTAGYYADGRRFLRELRQDDDVPLELLVRIR